VVEVGDGFAAVARPSQVMVVRGWPAAAKVVKSGLEVTAEVGVLLDDQEN